MDAAGPHFACACVGTGADAVIGAEGRDGRTGGTNAAVLVMAAERESERRPSVVAGGGWEASVGPLDGEVGWARLDGECASSAVACTAPVASESAGTAGSTAGRTADRDPDTRASPPGRTDRLRPSPVAHPRHHQFRRAHSQTFAFTSGCDVEAHAISTGAMTGRIVM